MNKIKGVIFDLDDTLYDYKRANQYAENCLAEYASARFGISVVEFDKAFQQGKEYTKKLLKEGAAQHSRLLYIQHALEALKINPVGVAVELETVFWENFMKAMELCKGSLVLLQKLRTLGIKIGICTDFTAEVQHTKLVRLGIADYVDALVTSEETGCEKPNALMFQLILKKLCLQNNEVLVIGDNWNKDIQGAVSIGIKSVWYQCEAEEKTCGADSILRINSYTGKDLQLLMQAVTGGEVR